MTKAVAPDGCPVCHETGGFHDTDAHRDHQGPRELIKEAGWHKRKDGDDDEDPGGEVASAQEA